MIEHCHSHNQDFDNKQDYLLHRAEGCGCQSCYRAFINSKLEGMNDRAIVYDTIFEMSQMFWELRGYDFNVDEFYILPDGSVMPKHMP